MVSNDRTVHEEKLHAAACAAVDGVTAVVIRLGQAIARLQAEVGRRGARGIIIAVFVIGRTVRIEDDNAAVHDCIRNGIDRRRFALIIVICALGCLRHTLGLLLILFGEAAVNAIVRLEQVHIAPMLRAALGIGTCLYIRRIICHRLSRGRDLLQPGRIGAGDPLLRQPGDLVSARLDRTGDDLVLCIEIVANCLRASARGRVPLRRRLLHAVKRVEQRIRSGIIRRREHRVRIAVGRERRHGQ